MHPKTKISKKLKKYRRQQDLQIGLLGNYNYVVEVPGRPNYVYVRLVGQVVSQVYNDRVNPVLDLQVYVGYDDEEPRLLQVLGVRSDLRRYGTDETNVGYIAEHHRTHEWMAFPDGGNDVVFSELRQFMPLRPTPISTGIALNIGRGILLDYNKNILYVTGAIVDLSDYIPTTGSRFAYVGIDQYGAPSVTGGFVRDTFTLTFADAPDFIPGTYPIALVRLYSGQTRIEEAYSSTDLADLRFPFPQSFLNLFDAPSSFLGSANKGIFVNSSETGLEFRYVTGTSVGGATGSVTTFLELTDTPSSYVGSAQRVVAVNDAATGLEFRILTGTSATSFTGTSFLELSDTPNIYSGSANKGVFVNTAETEVEFRTLTGTVQAIYLLSGDLTVHTGALALENRLGRTLTLVGVYARINTAPTGTSAIFDVNKNGSTTIFTNQAHRPQIITGSTSGNTTIIDIASFEEGDYYLVDCDQADGANASLTLKFVY